MTAQKMRSWKNDDSMAAALSSVRSTPTPAIRLAFPVGGSVDETVEVLFNINYVAYANDADQPAGSPYTFKSSVTSEIRQSRCTVHG